jgi:hypothetical protein
MKPFKQRKKNQSGFIIADFLFSFVLVIGIGLFIFALTFSLATIEISQYIVWSAARAYASANKDESTARDAATQKFNNLSAQFPLLTGSGESAPWFLLDDFKAQDHETESTFISKVTNTNDRMNRDGALERRQPWTGASANLYLKLFANMNIPFLGKVSDDAQTTFTFRVYSFIIRNPSFEECHGFFEHRFKDGIQNLEGLSTLGNELNTYLVEDNGC